MPPTTHILMAEDEDLVALTLSAILESHDYRVTVTHDGQQALEAAAKDPPDLLVTDLLMPVMQGRELIAHLRQSYPNLPVVVMTGFSDSIPAEDPGRLVVVLKPFSTGALVRAIQALLPRAV
jgi:CheY-like chemotaxis protein